MTDPLERYERTHPTRRIGQIDWTPAGQSDTDQPLTVRYCDTYNPDTGYCTHAGNHGGAPSQYAPDPASADPFPVTFTEPVSHTYRTGCAGNPAPVEGMPLRCPACLDKLATELENEYRAAIERNQDRAQEARAGAYDVLKYYAYLRRSGPRDHIPLDGILPSSRDADRWHANQYRAARVERDAVRQRHDDYDPSAAR